jgi:hypothetical protein
MRRWPSGWPDESQRKLVHLFQEPYYSLRSTIFHENATPEQMEAMVRRWGGVAGLAYGVARAGIQAPVLKTRLGRRRSCLVKITMHGE